MAGFLDGLISPLLTQTANARGAYVAGQKQENDKQIANQLQVLTLKRQAEKDDLARQLGLANIAHLNAETGGQWDKPFGAEDESGPGLFQYNKYSDAVRRVRINGGPATSNGPTVPGGSPATNNENAGGRASDQIHDVPGNIDLNDLGKYSGSPAGQPPAQDTTQRVGAGGSTLRPLPKVAPPHAPTSQEQAAARVRALTSQGMPLAKANEQARAEFAFEPPPPPTNVYTTGTDPNTQQATIFAGPSKGTPSLTNLNVGKPVGGAGGGQSLSPEDRAKMLNQAKLDNATMKRIEKRVLDGDLTFGTGAGLATAAAGAHGSPLNESVGVLGNAVAGMMDPDIQQYITANESYARIMGNLQSKRYTDNQAGIEKRISGLKGNDLKNTISYKQDLRDKSLDDPAIVPAVGGGRGAGGAPTHSAPHSGLTDAQKARAASDPQYAEFLRSTGKLP